MSSDLISRQAVIDTVQNYWEKRIDTLPTRITEDGEAYDTKSLNEILEHNKILVGLIKAIPSEPGKVIAEVKVDTDEIMERVKDEIFPLIPQWIPVTERLPERNGVYLVTVVDSGNEWRFVDDPGYINGEWYVSSGEVYSDWHKGFRIIAWMPLPEPYKEADR